MRIKEIMKRLFTSAGLAAIIAGSAVAGSGSPAMAAPTTCKTIQVSGYAWQTINPRMTVPICYNGGSVWQNGPITPGFSSLGYYINGFDWYGSYGVGENFAAHLWTNAATFYCTPRWTINTWGQVTSYNRNC